MEWRFAIELVLLFSTFTTYICFESIGRSSDSLWGEEEPSFFVSQNFGENISNLNKREFPMIEYAKYEEEITITKSSTDSLHIRIPYNPEHIQRIRQITGRQWESKLKVWIIPYTIAAVQEFINQFDPNDVQFTPEPRTVTEGIRVTRIKPQND